MYGEPRLGVYAFKLIVVYWDIGLIGLTFLTSIQLFSDKCTISPPDEMSFLHF